LPDLDREANGPEELFGQELGGRGDTWVHVDNLLGQDGHIDAEQANLLAKKDVQIISFSQLCRMTVAHTWLDQNIEAINTAEDASREEGQKRRLKGSTADALLRVAALCNRAEFKPGQVNEQSMEIGSWDSQ